MCWGCRLSSTNDCLASVVAVVTRHHAEGRIAKLLRSVGFLRTSLPMMLDLRSCEPTFERAE